MQPAVEAAVIAAASTSFVALVGFIANAVTTYTAVSAAKASNEATLAAAQETTRDERLWAKQSAMYEELLAECSRQQAIGARRVNMLTEADEEELEAGPGRAGFDWYALAGRVHAYASEEVLNKFDAWLMADVGAGFAKRTELDLHETMKGEGKAAVKAAEELPYARDMTRAHEKDVDAAFEALVAAVRDVLHRRK